MTHIPLQKAARLAGQERGLTRGSLSFQPSRARRFGAARARLREEADAGNSCIGASFCSAFPARRQNRNIRRCLPVRFISAREFAYVIGGNRNPQRQEATAIVVAALPPSSNRPSCSSRQRRRSPAARATIRPTAEQSPMPSDDRTPVSLDQLCNALLTSAQDNNLPVAFFANLIWQESRLRDDAVSPKGALGIAQFMPKTAVEHRPRRSVRSVAGDARVGAAAARAARSIRQSRFRRRRLQCRRPARQRMAGAPAHTAARDAGYVIHVTGRSVEQWQKTPPDDAALRFVRRLPCRDMPAFAELEQAQSQQAQVERRADAQANSRNSQRRPKKRTRRRQARATASPSASTCAQRRSGTQQVHTVGDEHMATSTRPKSTIIARSTSGTDARET